ncbi:MULTISPECIES: alpha/beta family hydrolase [unclassified Pseudomonas]|uniref:alpha/beta family hydrolase n=1 Tax=unclassified Pseudomonas TaxID=196821 RepID=UPI0006D40A88|nr:MULTISPECIES: alpha/beta family hydrolase [unclassified Pseudomonas]
MKDGQCAGIDGDQWAQVGNVPGLRVDPPQIRGDQGRFCSLILAHGAGAPMDSAFMDEIAQRLAGLGIGVIRFEFPYMAERRINGGKRPPNPQKVLLECWREVYGQVRPLVTGTLAVGGKSMGGRMASLLADELEVDALVCLGYPFYAVGKPEKPRVEHLAELKTPTLIVQGERDALGNREAVEGYALSPAIEVNWLVAGDHDLKPLKASGFSHEQHLQAAAEKVAGFLKG